MNRVMLLLEQSANAHLLAEYLKDRYDVVGGAEEALHVAHFDLVIVDGPMLDRLGTGLRQRREQEQPVLLPILLVTARREIGLATRHLWNTVDELIRSPIQKLELQARVEILLRARRLSLLNHRILYATGQGILGIGPDGKITLANSMAHLLLGYPPRQLVGKQVRELLVGSEISVPVEESENWIDLALRSGSVVSDHGGRLYQYNGSVMPTDLVVTPLESGNGREGAVLVFSDLTEMQRLNEMMEQKVHERTAELTTANQELESFSYSVSYDLRGPLRAVNGFGQTLLEGYSDQLDAQGRDYINRMIAASDRMSIIIDGLLHLSR